MKDYWKLTWLLPLQKALKSGSILACAVGIFPVKVETKNRLDQRIEETNRRIDELRVELRGEIGKITLRLDRLHEVIVRRDEHEKLEDGVSRLEHDL